MKLKDAYSLEEKFWPTWWAAVSGVAQSQTRLKRLSSSSSSRQHIKKQRHCFANKGPSSQGYGFSSSHVWMWELDYKESWVPKNWCFWTVVLKTLEKPLDCKEIQPVHPKGNQSWIFIGRTDVEAETLILGHLIRRADSFEKTLMLLERLKARGEGDSRGWDGWMASLTQWKWVWANSGRQWRTGKPGILQSMGSQRVGHNSELSWAPELNWTTILSRTSLFFWKSSDYILVHESPHFFYWDAFPSRIFL